MNPNMTDQPTRHSDRVRDRRIEQVVPLVSPAELLEELPLGPCEEDQVLRSRAEIARILPSA